MAPLGGAPGGSQRAVPPGFCPMPAPSAVQSHPPFVASTIAKMPACTGFGSVGQASINRRRSGSSGVDNALGAPDSAPPLSESPVFFGVWRGGSTPPGGTFESCTEPQGSATGCTNSTCLMALISSWGSLRLCVDRCGTGFRIACSVTAYTQFSTVAWWPGGERRLRSVSARREVKRLMAVPDSCPSPCSRADGARRRLRHTRRRRRHPR